MNISLQTRRIILPYLSLVFAALVMLPGQRAQAWETDGCNAANVPEFDEYTLIYQYAIPADSDFGDQRPAYSVNNAGVDVAFNRIAYCLELDVGGALQWVWVSMDNFTNVVRDIGIPYNSTTQLQVQNLNVWAGGATVTTGTGIANGNIEFWEQRSLTAGSLGLGGNDALNDFDDAPNGTAGSGGSMQVHNTDAQETIFAYNNWDSLANLDDLGIGNAPSGNPDWHGAANAGTYTDRRDMYILVRKREVFRHAGDGEQEGLGDDGNAWQADINNPRGMAMDSSGNVYIADAGQQRIRRVTPGGIISTYAGTGTAGFTADGQLATSTNLNDPVGLAFDSNDNLYYADQLNRRVRMIDAATGIVTTVAGNGSTDYNGDNIPATTATIRLPVDVHVSGSGNIYIADRGHPSLANNGPRIRMVSGGTITTVAGNGKVGNAGSTGQADTEPLDDPWSVYVDANDNIYISDSGNNAVRVVDGVTGNMTVLAGNTDGTQGSVDPDGEPAGDSGLRSPRGITGDASGNIYIADYNNDKIHKVDANGMIRTIVGSGVRGYNGDGRDALRTDLNRPFDVVVLNDDADVVFSEFFNDRTRLVAIATANSAPSDIQLSNTSVSVLQSGVTWVGDLTTTDDDIGDVHLYELVTGVGGDDNALFRINPGGTNLRALDPSTMVVGDYSVRIQTDDQNGGTFQEAFVVSVVSGDAVPPVITLIGDATVNVTTGSVYTDAGAMATDDVDGDITANIVTVSNVDTSTPGAYQVTYNVMDAGLNAATEVVRTVIVADDATPPVISLIGAASINVTRGTAYVDPGATATDNADGDITADIVTVNNVNINRTGTYQVTYDVMDAAGNAAVQVVRTVNVQDPPPPPTRSSGGGSFGALGLLFLMTMFVRRRIFVR